MARRVHPSLLNEGRQHLDYTLSLHFYDPFDVEVWLAAGATNMRKGFDGLAAFVQTQLAEDPFSGQLFVFRGKCGDRVKILWWDGDGLCLFAKRLERGHFVWPQATHGTVDLSAAQLSML